MRSSPAPARSRACSSPSTTAPVPRYGSGSLADLLPAARRRARRPGHARDRTRPRARRPGLRLPGRRPGLGAARAHPGEAPFLHLAAAQLAAAAPARPITAGFPVHHRDLARLRRHRPAARARTACPATPSLDPATGAADEPAALAALDATARAGSRTPPSSSWPRPPGCATCQVSAPTFEHTPLTKIALSGGTFHGRLSGEERMDLAAERLAAGGPRPRLHATTRARRQGPPLRRRLRRLARPADASRPAAQRLAEQLPPRSALYVTADHGMIDIPFDPRVADRLRRGLGAARRRRPAGRRGPGPARVRGPRCGGRCASRLARGARRADVGGHPRRGHRRRAGSAR